jgi:beta-fructofuranosidase
MVSWEVQEQPILSPDSSYDAKGVFTGCFIKAKDGSLNYIYTSVSALPIHHTLPHQYGCETLSIVTSFDHGKTWSKGTKNPIMPGEPPGLDVTGWRDPFCAPWSNMSAVLGFDPDTTFGIISGGIRDVTPTSFLYKVDTNDLSDWSYIGPLTNFGLNLRPSRWSGDLGRNWEVTNFLSLNNEQNPAISHDFLIMGIEGCLDEPSRPNSSAGPSRPTRGQLWMSGSVSKNQTSGAIDMSYGFGGHLDHGCLYAANSFFDPKTQNHVVWGWITEEDLCDGLRHQQGWSGVLSMPRQLYMQTLDNVVRASSSDLSSITSICLKSKGKGVFTLQTLASEPYQPLVESLRIGSRTSQLQHLRLPLDQSRAVILENAIRSKQWELQCSFKLSSTCASVGVLIGHKEGKQTSILLFPETLLTLIDFTNSTAMTFEPQNETFTITRPSFQTPDTSLLVNNSPEVAPHTLFTRRDPTTEEEYSETLDIRAWRDNSVLEVFVNGRTAISTRIYAGEETFGMQFFANETAIANDDLQYAHQTELVNAKLWDGLSTTV